MLLAHCDQYHPDHESARTAECQGQIPHRGRYFVVKLVRYEGKGRQLGHAPRQLWCHLCPPCMIAVLLDIAANSERVSLLKVREQVQAH